MGLTAAYGIAQQSLSTISAEAAVLSSNIAGVNATGTFNQKTANIETTADGSVLLTSVSRAQNQALFDSALSATSASATQTALSQGLASLQETTGDTDSTNSPAAEISSFINALQSFTNTPSDASLGSSLVTAADNLASSLNSATLTVQQTREQADSQMATSVAQINSLLTQFQSLNNQIIQGTAAGQDVTGLEDQRDTTLTQLSQQIGITTSTDANGSMSIYTDSGVTLFEGGQPRSVTFQPTQSFAPGVAGNAVFIDGVPVTGTNSPMPIQSGTLAGLATLRDDTAVTYQNQLDQIANGLISATAETFNSGGGNTTAPGLFTFAGSNGAMPTSFTGLADEIEVNPAVDPNQGGNPDLIRDGINFNFNTGDDAGFATQLQSLLNNVQGTQTFSASGQIGTSNTLQGFAQASVGWLDGQVQTVTNESSFQSTLLNSTTSALSNATGVNLDNELSKMLDLEQSYSSSAQLLTTINSMFTSLVQAVSAINGASG